MTAAGSGIIVRQWLPDMSGRGRRPGRPESKLRSVRAGRGGAPARDGRHCAQRTVGTARSAPQTLARAPARLAGPPVGRSYGSCRIRHHSPPMADILTREAVEKRLQLASITSKNRCTYLRQAAGTDRKERYSGFAGKGRGRVPRRGRGWEQRVRREKEARAGAG